METKKSPIYGNWRVHHPTGSLMFYCDKRRADWYLKRNLAVQTGEKEIQLTFTPRGKGSSVDLYGASPKANLCVVCGKTEEGLTRHHIVPYCFRRFFPEVYKSKNSYDVVPLCEEHHLIYERKADIVKRQLNNKYGEKSLKENGQPPEHKAKSFLHCLMNTDRCEKIPAERLELMRETVKTVLKLSELPEDLGSLYASIKIETKKDQVKYGKMIVSKIPDIQAFVEMWREHFLKTMNPQFMPAGWYLKKDARKVNSL